SEAAATTPAVTSSSFFMAGFYYREALSVDRGPDLGPRSRLVIGGRGCVAEVDSRSRARIWRVRRGPDTDYLERQPIAVDLYDDEMMRVLLRRRPGLHQVLHAYVLARARCEIRAQIGFAGVRIDRRTASARDQSIHP